MTGVHAAEVDPIDFVVEAFEAAGGLVERDLSSPLVLLPTTVARSLGTPEEFRLGLQGSETETGAGFGTPLLEKLVTQARSEPCWAQARLDADPPRLAHVRAALGRFSVRNGLVDHGDLIAASMARYAVVVGSYAAQADDRSEGIVWLVVGASGSEPDRALQESLQSGALNTALLPVTAECPAAQPLKPWIWPRMHRAVQTAVAPFFTEARRRYARDHERVVDYFAAVARETNSPRRRADPAAVRAAVDHLADERDAKLRDLGQRYATRVTTAIAAFVHLQVPAVKVQALLRRRKSVREVQLCVPAFAQDADALGCEGCGMAATRIALCDERLHILCQECAPNAQGRIACPACQHGLRE